MAGKQASAYWQTQKGKEAAAITTKLLDTLPLVMQQDAQNIVLTGKKSANIDSEIQTRAADVQRKSMTAMAYVNNINSQVSTRLATIKLNAGKLDVAQRAQQEKQINDMLTQARGQVNGILTSAALGVDAPTVSQVMKTVYGDGTAQNPGLYSQIDQMEQTSQQFFGTVLPATPQKAPGTPSSTQTTPQKGGIGAYTTYDKNQPQYISAGPHQGLYTYKGLLFKLVNGKPVRQPGAFSNSSDNRYQQAPNL